jgi:hypothetical protein
MFRKQMITLLLHNVRLLLDQLTTALALELLNFADAPRAESVLGGSSDFLADIRYCSRAWRLFA